MGAPELADRLRTASVPAHHDYDDGSDAPAAAAAEAARVAAQPLDPATRAAEGFRIASGPTSGGALATQAVDDAGANARTAMSRTDLPPTMQQQLRTTLERLGNAVIDGKIDPHMNDAFRQQLYNLATTGPNTGEFREALAHMTRAAQVLDQVPLAKGTQLAFDAQGRKLGSTGLPGLDVPKLDADLYFKQRNGTLVVESSKYGTATFASEVKDSRTGAKEQIARQSEWASKGTAAEPRAARYFMLDKNEGFGALLDDRNLGELDRRITQPGERNIVIGDRAYSLEELKALDAKGKPLADAYVAQQKAAHLNSGHSESSFNSGDAYKEFYKRALATPETAMRTYGLEVGQPVKDLKPMTQPEVGNVRQGGLAGATGAGVIELTKLAFKGDRITWQDVGHATTETLKGGAIGAVAAKAERYVIPAVERRIGTAVESKVAQVAAQKIGQSAAASSGAGLVARTAASRVIGSTAVGTVITTGMSAWENRAGLAKGESKAIGNVTADTVVGVVAVGVSSVAGAAAAGALAGSVVPGLGTAVGFAVGLGVGVAITYGAQLSGARDAIANGASKAVDWVKSWF